MRLGRLLNIHCRGTKLFQSNGMSIQRFFVPHRYIQTTVQRREKLFFDRQNNHAHNIMAQNKLYTVYCPPDLSIKKSVNFSPNTEWHNLNPDAILNGFRTVVLHCQQTNTCLSNEMFDSFVHSFLRKCLDFSDEQLIEALKILVDLPETNSLNTRNFKELWQCLDDVCSERIKDWELERVFLVCDLWYHLNLGRVNNFNWHASKKIGRKVRKMSAHQLVQSMFYCNILRSPIIEMFDFEVRMGKCLDSMTIDEIGIMCMGFFKTQTTIKTHDLIERIIERLCKETDTVNDITLVNIVKIIRYSSKPIHMNPINKLLDNLTPEIERINMLCGLHVALTGSDIQLCHAKSTEKILHKFLNNIKSARIKDLERISFVVGFCDFQSSSGIENELCTNILNELKTRVEEITNFPKCLTNTLHFLSFKGFHDKDILSTVLDEQFLCFAYNKSHLLGREIFALDSYARINLHESYQGNLLADRRRRTMGKLLSHYIPDRTGKFKISATDKLLLEIFETLQELYKHSKIAHVLPHYERPDCILAYNRKEKQVINISDHFPMLYSGQILSKSILLKEKPNADDIQLVNFIIGGWNMFERNTDKQTGPLKLKIEQSQIIGFTPVMIPWNIWIKLTTDEQKIYIQHRLKEFFKVKLI